MIHTREADLAAGAGVDERLLQLLGRLDEDLVGLEQDRVGLPVGFVAGQAGLEDVELLALAAVFPFAAESLQGAVDGPGGALLALPRGCPAPLGRPPLDS